MSIAFRTQLLLAFLAFTAMTRFSASAQEATSTPADVKVLEVRITEFTINEPIDSELSHNELLEKIAASIKSPKEGRNGATPFATVKNVYRFSHVVGVESNIQVGRTVGITTGETQTGRGGATMRNITMRDVGTLIKFQSSPTDSGAIKAQIVYESSDVEESKPDTIAPEISQLSIESTMLLPLGKTVLLVGSEAPKSKVLTISIK